MAPGTDLGVTTQAHWSLRKCHQARRWLSSWSACHKRSWPQFDSGRRSFAACHIPLSLPYFLSVYCLTKGVYARKKSCPKKKKKMPPDLKINIWRGADYTDFKNKVLSQNRVVINNRNKWRGMQFIPSCLKKSKAHVMFFYFHHFSFLPTYENRQVVNNLMNCWGLRCFCTIDSILW